MSESRKREPIEFGRFDLDSAPMDGTPTQTGVVAWTKDCEEIEKDIRALKQLLEELPGTECDNRGSCCENYLTINAYTIEAMNIARHLRVTFSPEEIEKYRERARKAKAVRGVFEEVWKKDGNMPVVKWPCPFWHGQEKRCEIYEHRPLTCRLYGLHGECDVIRGRGGCDLDWSEEKTTDLGRRLQEHSNYFALTEGRATNLVNITDTLEYFYDNVPGYDSDDGEE